MSEPSHYDTLRLSPSASETEVRDAYRRLARQHHPDRAASEPDTGSVSMPQINEAYRVLSDPARRAVYDAGLRRNGGDDPSPAPSVPTTPNDAPYPRTSGPALFPWRGVLFIAVIGIVAVVALAQFTEPSEPRGPDGILRVGDCVTIEANGDAREVLCTGDETVDLRVDAFVGFDDECLGRTEAHRDHQGMGVACVAVPTE